MVDVLHTIDLGLSSHVVGNVIWWLAIVCSVFGGTTQAEKMALCHAHMKKWYRSTKCPHRLRGKLTVERVRTTAAQWPQLSAKAASTRCLAPYALHLMQKFGVFDGPDVYRRRHDTLALGVCQLLVRFYHILQDEANFISEVSRAELPGLANQLMSFYSQLADMGFTGNYKLWKASPKMHLFMHLCLHQAIFNGNPRYYWTYGDEDLVGRLISIAEGLHPSTFSVSILMKWVHAVCCDTLLSDDEE